MKKITVTKSEAPKLVPQEVDIYAKISDFPGCCGAQVLKELNEDDDRLEEELADLGTPQGIKKGLRQGKISEAEAVVYFAELAQLKLSYAHAYSKENLHTETGTLFATTIPSMKASIARLKIGGWKPLYTWRNPNTENPVTLWVLSCSELPLGYRAAKRGRR